MTPEHIQQWKAVDVARRRYWAAIVAAYRGTDTITTEQQAAIAVAAAQVRQVLYGH